MARTFLMIKPDGVRRGLVGEIIGRFEKKGWTLIELKMLTPPRELAEAHYGVHRDKPFFNGVVSFITSGPVVAMVWEGDNIRPRHPARRLRQLHRAELDSWLRQPRKRR
jgi:nucleoside-diphosphate kinase